MPARRHCQGDGAAPWGHGLTESRVRAIPERSVGDAIQMQLRRSRRAIALLLAGCVVFAGLAALRHETAVAHVRGALTGELEHAHALADYHELSTTPHLHGRDVDAHAEAGACHLLAALDHSTILPGSPLTSSTVRPLAVTAVLPFALEPPARAVYRLAPKTSPPAANV